MEESMSHVFWAVWHHRNKAYHQGEWQCTTRLISFIKLVYTVSEDLGFKKLVVEGNSLTVIKKIQISMNHVVHIMVEEGKRCDSPKIWIEEAPPRTESAVEEDRRSLLEGEMSQRNTNERTPTISVSTENPSWTKK
ncbi:hypothetical protein Goshw_015167, partial [Gossypium schwendimanii]|nr:hypothetical protein [Gossypium schwendimanii]